MPGQALFTCPRSALVQLLGLRGASRNEAEVNHPVHDVICHGDPHRWTLLSQPQDMAVDSCAWDISPLLDELADTML